MLENNEVTLIKVEISGELLESPPKRQPPRELLVDLPGIEVDGDSRIGQGFNGVPDQTFIFDILSDIIFGAAGNALYDLGKWLFDRFRRPRKGEQCDGGDIAKVTITTIHAISKNGEATEVKTKKQVTATGPESLVKELLEIVKND
ncbi:hypothetical protein [Brevibacterium sp. VCM10]|uniref:hypothetical protein n=1 Tax=Brevibacterium sp. VCM10 TaxID=1381751 RepID=UPI0012DE3C60|nr:hypothetical protein [Brevibacterium sp. VCM10]